MGKIITDKSLDAEIRKAHKKTKLLLSFMEQKECVRCGSTLVIKIKRKGNTRFWSCPYWPDCDYSENFIEEDFSVDE